MHKPLFEKPWVYHGEYLLAWNSDRISPSAQIFFKLLAKGEILSFKKWYKQDESIGFIQQYYKKKGRKEQGKQMTDEDHLLKKLTKECIKVTLNVLLWLIKQI